MSDMMSQEEIDAMLAGAAGGGDAAAEPPQQEYLTQDEKDILGEIGNISMGTSATTMYTLLNKRVVITTPVVSVYENARHIISEYSKPFVIAQVKYTEGLEGNNLLMLKEEDAAVITDLLMGGSGEIDKETVALGELEISAMAEVMNQMVGSSSTALADLLGIKIDISPPKCDILKNTDDPLDGYFEDGDEPIIRINFAMEIEGVLNSEIMQAMPLKFGKSLVAKLMDSQGMTDSGQPADTTPAAPEPQAAAPEPQQAAPVPEPAAAQPQPQAAAPQPAAQPQPEPMAQQPMQPQPAPMPQQPVQQPVEVKQVQYQSFDAQPAVGFATGNENMDLLMDVPLQVTVELGQTKKSIQEILEFGTGSVIVLDKLAGELVEVMVNGKLVARGEVVVIEENYGVRITDIVSQNQRMNII